MSISVTVPFTKSNRHPLICSSLVAGETVGPNGTIIDECSGPLPRRNESFEMPEFDQENALVDDNFILHKVHFEFYHL